MKVKGRNIQARIHSRVSPQRTREAKQSWVGVAVDGSGVWAIRGGASGHSGGFRGPETTSRGKRGQSPLERWELQLSHCWTVCLRLSIGSMPPVADVGPWPERPSGQVLLIRSPVQAGDSTPGIGNALWRVLTPGQTRAVITSDKAIKQWISKGTKQAIDGTVLWLVEIGVEERPGVHHKPRGPTDGTSELGTRLLQHPKHVILLLIAKDSKLPLELPNFLLLLLDKQLLILRSLLAVDDFLDKLCLLLFFLCVHLFVFLLVCRRLFHHHMLLLNVRPLQSRKPFRKLFLEVLTLGFQVTVVLLQKLKLQAKMVIFAPKSKGRLKFLLAFFQPFSCLLHRSYRLVTFRYGPICLLF
mmetsp:Transcript_19213/g.33973  ORF Transcript_19213/g.33973 Transcript_19213/m.33973 type:complete len:356 (+) Transcript_19213:392-1459(+)